MLAPVAGHFDVPLHHLPVEPAEQGAAEARQQRAARRPGVDLVVLARYMQILSPEFVAALAGAHHQHPPLVPAGVRGRQARTTRRTSAA